jgi:tetratricopeptide (TPR) repeat protein
VNKLGWIAVGIAACWMGVAAASARADEDTSSSDVSKAESYAAAAFDAYSSKHYEDAITLYMKALEAAPSADILYNLARIYDTKLKERKLAIEYYHRYTQDTGADPDRLRTANERLSELRELDAVSKEALNASSTAASQPLVAPPTAALPPPSAAARGADITGLQVTGIVAGAVGLAGLGFGVGFGIAAKSDADVAHGFCHGNACSTQRGVDASREGSHFATVSTIAFIAGGALTALGVSLLALGGQSDSERPHAQASITPYVGPGALGTYVSGRW